MDDWKPRPPVHRIMTPFVIAAILLLLATGNPGCDKRIYEMNTFVLSHGDEWR